MSYLFSEKPVAQLERALNRRMLCNTSASGGVASSDTLRAPGEAHVLVVDNLESLCPASVRRAERAPGADSDALRASALFERLFACIERYPSCRLLVIGTALRIVSSFTYLLILLYVCSVYWFSEFVIRG